MFIVNNRNKEIPFIKLEDMEIRGDAPVSQRGASPKLSIEPEKVPKKVPKKASTMRIRKNDGKTLLKDSEDKNPLTDERKKEIKQIVESPYFSHIWNAHIEREAEKIEEFLENSKNKKQWPPGWPPPKDKVYIDERKNKKQQGN